MISRPIGYNTISDPMSDNVIRKYTYLKVSYPMRPKAEWDTGVLKVCTDDFIIWFIHYYCSSYK